MPRPACPSLPVAVTRSLAPRLLRGLGLWLASASAFAAAPLSTDDPGVLGAGQCEYEAYFLESRQTPATERTTSAQMGCGLGWATQLNLFGAHTRAPDGSMNPIGVHGKTVLREGGADGASDISLALGYGWLGRREDDRWLHSGAGVLLLAGSTLRPGTTLLVNLGHAHNAASHRHATNWGVAVEQEASAALTMVAEVFGDDFVAPCWAAGLRWKAPAGGLTFGLTWGLTHDSTRTHHLTLGVTWMR